MPNLSSHRRNAALVSLGTVIRDMRLASSLTQEQLALTAELDRSYVGQVERGDSNVAILNLKRIADALGTTIEVLMQRASL